MVHGIYSTLLVAQSGGGYAVGFLIAIIVGVLIFGLLFSLAAVVVGVVALVALVGVAAIVGFVLVAVVTQDMGWAGGGAVAGAVAMLIYLGKSKSKEGKA
jgi:hypothetical protein